MRDTDLKEKSRRTAADVYVNKKTTTKQSGKNTDIGGETPGKRNGPRTGEVEIRHKREKDLR